MKQPVPEWRAWAKAHGMTWGADAKAKAKKGIRVKRAPKLR